jgi:hypothetical protein
MLVNGGYRGYVSLEYEEDDPDAGVPRVAAALLRGVRKYSACSRHRSAFGAS